MMNPHVLLNTARHEYLYMSAQHVDDWTALTGVELVRAQTVVMVVGAGRGPLIRASLNAAAATGRRVRVWAVEKNVNAVVHIEALIAAERYTTQPPPPDPPRPSLVCTLTHLYLRWMMHSFTCFALDQLLWVRIKTPLMVHGDVCKSGALRVHIHHWRGGHIGRKYRSSKCMPR